MATIPNINPAQPAPVPPTPPAAATPTPSVTAQQTPAAVSGKNTPAESLSHKNNDGTYGPKKTLHPPSYIPPETVVDFKA